MSSDGWTRVEIVVFDVTKEDPPEHLARLVEEAKGRGRPRIIPVSVWGAVIDEGDNVLAYRSGNSIRSTMNLLLKTLRTRYEVELDPKEVGYAL
jgi:hypothetical protein